MVTYRRTHSPRFGVFRGLGTVLVAQRENHPAIASIHGQEPCVVVGYNGVGRRDGATVLVYSEPDQAKLRHIEANPNVALHLDSQAGGDDIVIVSGTAAIDASAPLIQDNELYIGKYEAEMLRLNLGTPAEMSKTYSVAIRITPTRVRGF